MDHVLGGDGLVLVKEMRLRDARGRGRAGMGRGDVHAAGAAAAIRARLRHGEVRQDCWAGAMASNGSHCNGAAVADAAVTGSWRGAWRRRGGAGRGGFGGLGWLEPRGFDRGLDACAGSVGEMLVSATSQVCRCGAWPNGCTAAV